MRYSLTNLGLTSRNMYCRQSYHILLKALFVLHLMNSFVHCFGINIHGSGSFSSSSSSSAQSSLLCSSDSNKDNHENIHPNIRKQSMSLRINGGSADSHSHSNSATSLFAQSITKESLASSSSPSSLSSNLIPSTNVSYFNQNDDSNTAFKAHQSETFSTSIIPVTSTSTIFPPLPSKIQLDFIKPKAKKIFQPLTFYQKLTFQWVFQLMKLGNNRSLDIEDLWFSDQYHNCVKNSSLLFNYYFNIEKQKLLMKGQSISMLPQKQSQLQQQPFQQKFKQQLSNLLIPSFVKNNILTEFYSSPLTKAILKMYKTQFIYSGVLKFFNTLIQFTPSIIISKILSIAATQQNLRNQLTTATAATVGTIVGSASASVTPTAPLISSILRQLQKHQQYGFIYAIVLLLALCGKTFIENQYFDEVINLSSNIRNTLAAAVFQKSLLLNPSGRQNNTVGEMVNYMQLDTARMEYVAGSIHTLWDGMLQVAGYTALLLHFLGPSVLAGIVCMLVIIPLNAYFFDKLSLFKAELLQRTDSRVKLTNEVLQGIRAIKSYHWEIPFTARLANIRNQELLSLKKSAGAKAALVAILSAAPSFVAVITLSVYAALGNILSPTKVFTALALFNQLRFPLIFFPMLLNTLAEGKISLKRLTEFLLSKEIDNYVVNPTTVTTAATSGSSTASLSSIGNCDGSISSSGDTSAAVSVVGAGSVKERSIVNNVNILTTASADTSTTTNMTVSIATTPQSLAAALNINASVLSEAAIVINNSTFSWTAFPTEPTLSSQQQRMIQQQQPVVSPSVLSTDTSINNTSSTSNTPSTTASITTTPTPTNTSTTSNTLNKRGNLKNINLVIKKGEIVAVVGSVGSGKSSLLSAIMGDMYIDQSTSSYSTSHQLQTQQLQLSEVQLQPPQQVASTDTAISVHAGTHSLSSQQQPSPPSQSTTTIATTTTPLPSKKVVFVNGTIAYVPQTSWIPNTTFKNVILFGNNYNETYYNHVLKICKLGQDLVLFDNGDETDIGEKGANLSGGQKQRLSIARAVYEQNDLYFFDDPLSALDVQVGNKIFQDAILKELENKTRILVTHSLSVLPYVDRIVIMGQNKEGECGIIAQGRYNELIEQGYDLSKLVVTNRNSGNSNSGSSTGSTTSNSSNSNGGDNSNILVGKESKHEVVTTMDTTNMSSTDDINISGSIDGDKSLTDHTVLSSDSNDNSNVMQVSQLDNTTVSGKDSDNSGHRSNSEIDFKPVPPLPSASTTSSRSIRELLTHKNTANTESKTELSMAHQTTTTEVEGVVSEQKVPSTSTMLTMPVLPAPLKQKVPQTTTATTKLMTIEEKGEGAVDPKIYLTYLKSAKNPVLLGVILASFVLASTCQILQQWIVGAWTNDVKYTHFPLNVYLFAVASMAGGVAGFTWIRSYVGTMAGASASQTLHDNMVTRVLSAPLSFFESTPIGRLIQRFSKDIDQIDQQLPGSFAQLIASSLNIFASLLTIALATPSFAVTMVPIFASYLLITNFYRPIARELKKVDSISRSPIYSQFTETLNGLQVIRAFKRQKWFIRKNEVILDDNFSAFFALKAVDRWLSVRLELLGNCIVFAAAFLAVLTGSKSGPAGISLSNALSITGLLNWAVRNSAETESYMNSVERILYTTNQTPIESQTRYEDFVVKNAKKNKRSGGGSNSKIFGGSGVCDICGRVDDSKVASDRITTTAVTAGDVVTPISENIQIIESATTAAAITAAVTATIESTSSSEAAVDVARVTGAVCTECVVPVHTAELLTHATEVAIVPPVVHVHSIIEQMQSAELLKKRGDKDQKLRQIETDEELLQSGWPWRGGIEFNHVSMRYRQDFNRVLHDVSFTIQPGENIGIVGRTGSGKSTLFRVLLRLNEIEQMQVQSNNATTADVDHVVSSESGGSDAQQQAEQGSILIDGIDISKISLSTLRSRISIIPQDAVLFSGSIRLNLDPFNQHDDNTLWTALTKAHAATMIAKLPQGLDFMVSENGDNFSAGQKQLLCLTRALIRKSKILILDEATSSIDYETDKLIQQTIIQEFSQKGCTVLTIAHRLDSILNHSNRVLVMKSGQVGEFDKPDVLLKNPISLLFKLIQSEKSASSNKMKQ